MKARLVLAVMAIGLCAGLPALAADPMTDPPPAG